MIIVNSTTKVEYVAACEVIKKLVWLKLLIKDIECKQNDPTILYEDNDGAKA